jgi:hypothetical protein
MLSGVQLTTEDILQDNVTNPIPLPANGVSRLVATIDALAPVRVRE